MGVGSTPKLDSLYLSKDATFVESIVLRVGQSYPAGTSAQIIIRDDEEIALATWTGTVAGTVASFNQTDPDALNAIPHGAKFDLMINYANGNAVKHSYGRVVRSENRYPLVPTQDTTQYALQFSDTFDRAYVGKYWVPRSAGNAITIHDNPLTIPNTLGPNYSLFNSAAALWYAPMNTDSVTLTVSMLYVGDGKCTIVLCSDYSMTTWLGVQFTTGLFQDKIRVVKGTGPTTFNDAPGMSPVSNLVSNGDNYVIKYNNQSRVLTCYKNTSLSPIITWTDSSNTIANGPGYRYTGIVWNTSLFTPGAEPSAWSAKDGV